MPEVPDSKNASPLRQSTLGTTVPTAIRDNEHRILKTLGMIRLETSIQIPINPKIKMAAEIKNE